MAIADVSPRLPPIFPNNKSECSVKIFSNLNAPSGVAVETASMFLNFGVTGLDHVVIATGKLACKKALPSKAGLNILKPSPPKICLPSDIATIAPKAALVSLNVGGSMSANKIPVIIALPSIIVFFSPFIKFITISVPTAATKHVTIIQTASEPK